MSVFPLVSEKDPILKKKLEPFDFEKDWGPRVAENLIDTMLHYEGIGLAANQIGLDYRVFAMIHEENPIVLFNPELISVSDEKIKMQEGCLSFKGLYPKVTRPSGVAIKYFDENNQPMMASFVGLSARVILHEYDHLNGITFHDRAGQVDMSDARKKRKTYLRRMKNGS